MKIIIVCGLVAVVTALILFLAANTAFNGFPILASILGGDGYLPRQLHRRGDRLVFSNGIVILAGLAGLLIWNGVLLQIIGSSGTIVVQNKLINGIANDYVKHWLGWVIAVEWVNSAPCPASELM